MTEPELPQRSPLLMSPADTALLVIDAQGKLITLLPEHERIVWNIRRLLDGAAILGIERLGTEQYPQGLGPTVPELAARLPRPPESKLDFSAAGCGNVAQLRRSGITRVLLAGIETHVCIQQTALDLLADGYQVYLAVDAVGARHPVDHATALGRMESAGAALTTTEAALFEWCVRAGTAEFKQISQLVREPAPA